MKDFTNVVLHNGMSAFRSGYGCQHVLLKFTEDWRLAVEQRKQVGALLVDLSKAFDCLPHSLLVAKLDAYGFSRNAVTLLASYLTDRKQCVKVSSVRSDWQTLIKGVPQGSVMGPVAFNIFMNDLYFSIKNSTLYNYADDNTILAIGNTVSQVKDILVNEAKCIISWCNVNNMEANPSKFQVILANSKKTSEFCVNIDDSCIQAVPYVKLLGVHIDAKLNFSFHISQICMRASRQLNALNRVGSILDTSTRLQLYKSFIMCHFNYCPIVWHSCGKVNSDKLEKIQYRALKFIYDVLNTSYESLLSQAGLRPLEVHRQTCIIQEVFKCLQGKNPAYLCDMFTVKSCSYGLRRVGTLNLPQSRTNIGLHSFRYTGAKLWNTLPSDVRNMTELSELKNFLKDNFSDVKCTCNLCNFSSQIAQHIY